MVMPKDPVKADLARKRMSEAHKGQNLGGTMPPRSDEWKRKQRESQTGRKASSETKSKMSSVRKGVPKSEEHKRKISESHMGMHHLTDESKRKISDARKELYSGENHPMYGRPVSEETRKKLSKTTTQVWDNNIALRKIISDANSGEKNGGYIDGRYANYEMNLRIRQSTNYSNWMKSVYRRDKFTCILSGISKDLEAHHIKSFAVILEENNITTFEMAMDCKELWDIQNGITLNKDVHRSLHATYGKQIPPELFTQTLLPTPSNNSMPT